MTLKLLSKLRNQDIRITRDRSHHRFLNATRLFSDQPVSNLSTPDDNNNSNVIIKNKPQTTTSSLKQHELAKFAAISDTWWDSEGPFKPLHNMNPTRLAFIRSTLCRHFGKDLNCARPFEGLKIVDVGCGGGILSEPLARMGATVIGVDAVQKNINVARLHALVEEQRKFDAVIALENDGRELSLNWQLLPRCQMLRLDASFPVEVASIIKRLCSATLINKAMIAGDGIGIVSVIEHVAAPAEFCKSLSALTYPGGATVLSTINRSMRAYATAILAAEYLLHWLPKGTHQWSSFLTPEELVLILQRASINVKEMAGFAYNPLTGRWSLSDDISVNFIAFATKDATFGVGQTSVINLSDHCDSTRCTGLSHAWNMMARNYFLSSADHDARNRTLSLLVLLSLVLKSDAGGIAFMLCVGYGAGSYSFSSIDGARSVADYLWENFLGGQSISQLLDDAIVDGIDFDIEQRGTAYAALARKLSERRQGGKKVYFSSCTTMSVP
ncbi:unnamed protein product [Dovyalis caffra]|uniref:Ubiquinone biosynthesis O-methyltransferase, mitochondrial n=1 Tax=Dovyalis caffra TaxID=77055 RepID=A0AAV1SET4_9ROSI|nr:unnamed protein product [Dovyalis caffra]